MDFSLVPGGSVRCLLLGVFAGAGLLMSPAPPAVAQEEFPFDQEMLLDVKPLPGGKRVPILQVESGGRAQIDLWCKSGEAEVAIEGATIRITLGAMRDEPCTPERMQADEPLAAALAEVAQWRREDDVVVLTGPTELRFRLSTH